MSGKVKQYCVYHLENTKTGKIYVGVTDNIVRRIKQHEKKALSGKHRSNELYFDMEMSEPKTFKPTVFDGLSYSDALALEHLTVEILRETGIGCYNSVSGGKYPNQIKNSACFYDFQVFLRNKGLIPDTELTEDPYSFVSKDARPRKIFMRDNETPEMAMEREFKKWVQNA